MPAFFACCTCSAPEEQHESQEGNLISRDFFEEEKHILPAEKPQALKVLEDTAAVDEVVRNTKPPLPTKAETEVAMVKPLVIQITKPTAGSGLGLGLDVTPGAPIHIYDIVVGGPVSKYNEVADADRQIQVGSYLTAVNGVRGEVARILDAVGTSVTSEVEVWRPEVWVVSLEKKSAQDSLGLELDYCDSGRSLIISRIDEGAVRAFNEGNSGAAINAKDRILEVNGAEGSPSSLMSSLASTSITLKMSRPAGLATSAANSEDEERRAAVAVAGG